LKLIDITKENLNEILKVENECFSSPWRSVDFLQGLDDPLAVMKALCEGKEIIGFFVYWAILDEAHIGNFAICKNMQNKGYGKKLLNLLLKDAVKRKLSRATLEVRKGNANAIRLYEGSGFRAEGVRKGYYLDSGEDAIIMWRELKFRNKLIENQC
jgi:ribosomal-protein-alanine N-acetyltransferase